MTRWKQANAETAKVEVEAREFGRELSFPLFFPPVCALKSHACSLLKYCSVLTSAVTEGYNGDRDSPALLSMRGRVLHFYVWPNTHLPSRCGEITGAILFILVLTICTEYNVLVLSYET